MTTPEGRGETGDDRLTLIMMGVLAATVAAVSHETIGHAGACLATGGRVTLLTSIWFRCRPGIAATDVAGPLGSLACAMVALALLHRVPDDGRAPGRRIFLLTTLGISGFWFFGQLARDAFFLADDWGSATRDGGWPPGWRPLGVAAGVTGYVLLIRTCARLAAPLVSAPGVQGTRRLVVPWLAGVVSAVVAGAMWHGDPRSALEGAMAVGLGPLGYLLALRLARRAAPPQSTPAVVRRSGGWIAAGAIVYGAFLLLQARGIGPLAERVSQASASSPSR